jgi:hypothetical protein
MFMQMVRIHLEGTNHLMEIEMNKQEVIDEVAKLENLLLDLHTTERQKYASDRYVIEAQLASLLNIFRTKIYEEESEMRIRADKAVMESEISRKADITRDVDDVINHRKRDFESIVQHRDRMEKINIDGFKMIAEAIRELKK